MKKYYITEGGKTFGPFSLEELREKQISRDSYVWHQELSDWQTAGSLEELSELFEGAPLVPPPIQPPPVSDQPPPIPPPLVTNQPPPINQTGRYAPPSAKKPPRIWPIAFIGVGVPVIVFVVLLLTGVVKTPGLFEDILGGSPITGKPEKDAQTLIENQESFARLAREIARDGVIDDSELGKLEKAYRSMLLLHARYQNDPDGKREKERLLESQRGQMAERALEEAIEELRWCSGFDELERKIRKFAEGSNIDFY